MMTMITIIHLDGEWIGPREWFDDEEMRQKVMDEYNMITVRPGDKLLITFSRAITDEESDQIRRQMSENFPGISIGIADEVTGIVKYEAPKLPTEIPVPEQPERFPDNHGGLIRDPRLDDAALNSALLRQGSNDTVDKGWHKVDGEWVEDDDL